MDNKDKNLLKLFIKESKIPKVVYDLNLIDIIDMHMILLSQAILLLKDKKIKKKYVEIDYSNDIESLRSLTETNEEIQYYVNLLESVDKILKTNIM